MASIPLPALAAQPPQPIDPLAQIKNALALRNVQQQGQTQQLQQQALGQENQQRALDLKDQQTLRSLAPQFVTKDSSGQPTGYDADGFYNAALGGGVNPQRIIQMRSQQAEMAKNLAAAGSAQLDLQDKKNNQAYQIAEEVKSVASQPNADIGKINQAYQQTLPKLQQLGIDVSKYPAQFTTQGEAIDALNQHEVGLGVHKQTLDDAKTVAATNESQSKAQAEAWKEAGPGTLINIQTGQIYRGTMPADLQEMQDWLGKNPGKGPSDFIGAKAQITSKAELPYKVEAAAAEGAARANVEQQFARGSNAALAQVPSHLIAPATAAATKAGEDYAQSQSVSQRLSAMMDAAKNGNVVSYQLIPEEGALQVTTSQGVHRINMAEIQNYGGGSLFQRLEGHLGKQLTGRSIPDSVLNDMQEMQDIQQRGSQAKYENSLKTINQTYGANFKPVEPEPMKPAQQTAKPSGPPSGATHTAMGSDGKEHYTNSKGQDLGIVSQ